MFLLMAAGCAVMALLPAGASQGWMLPAVGLTSMAIWLAASSRRAILVILDDAAARADSKRVESFHAADVIRIDVRERHMSGKHARRGLEVIVHLRDGRERIVWQRNGRRVAEATAMARALSARWRKPIGETAVLTLGESRVEFEDHRIVIRGGLGEMADLGCATMFFTLFLGAFFIIPALSQTGAAWKWSLIIGSSVVGVLLLATLLKLVYLFRPRMILLRGPALTAPGSVREIMAADVATVEVRKAARISDFEQEGSNLQLVLAFRDERPPIAICERSRASGKREMHALALQVRRWIRAPAGPSRVSFVTHDAPPSRAEE